MPIFTGSGVAMVAAFDKSGINYDAQGKIIEHLIKGGADALIVCGTTGEPSTMTAAEKEELVRFTIKTVAKRIPVVVGSGGNNTAESIRFSQISQDLGADALMVVAPYYNKCTQNGLIAHYSAIAESVKLPIIVYNVPSRTVVDILPSTAARLSDIKNLVALKEASGDIHQISEVIRLTKGKMDIYSGDDSLAVPAIALGALGVISVAANAVPDKINRMTHLALQGDFKAAAKLHFDLAPLMQLLFCEVNPIPVKKAMEFLGFATSILRLPLTEMEPQNAAKLKAEMARLKIV